MSVSLSVLDLAPVPQGSDAGQALANSLDLAQHVERWGYHRFWLAEHHNMVGIASAATAVVIGHVASGTSKLRVGAGGIMLPNHAPLIVAEQFGTLATLFPGRIDLGLGRAPGTDRRTALALRRDPLTSADSFPQDVAELQRYFGDSPGPVQAVPGTGTHVPLWLLGSSLFSAQLAAAMGLPYAFASHFAPAALEQALHVYRSRFQPSGSLAEPRVMVAANLFAADSNEEAELMFTSVLQTFVALRFGLPGKLPPPRDDLAQSVDPLHLRAARQALTYSAVGDPEKVRTRLQQIIDQTGADELILSGHIYDHKARLRSYELGAEVAQSLRPAAPCGQGCGG